MKATPPKIIADLISALTASKDLSPFSETPMCAPTGSRVICTPPVTTTDDDWIVFVPCELKDEAMRYLESAGATHSVEQETYPDGVCYRYGDVNPILIWDYNTFYRWVAATHWAHKFNLHSKDERTSLFAALVDGSVPIDELTL